MESTLAKLNREVVFGQAGGRIIWQPRIGCWYNDKLFDGVGLPAPYTGMDLYQVYRSLGCSARLYEFNDCFKRIEHPAVTETRRSLNETDDEITIHTPMGKQVLVTRRTLNSPRLIHLKWEVETEDELKVAAWREENATWEWSQATYDRHLLELGDLGAPVMYMPRMNVQNLYIEKMGVAKGVYAIYDWPDTTEAFFRGLEESHDRMIELINASPIRIVNFGENVHDGTLSPQLFRKYHLPACQRRAEKLHAAGKFVYSHWDGNTHSILKYAHQTGLDGIEAITPQPQGDVTIDEIKAALGDDMFLLDGIPAIYFDDLFPVEVLEDCARRIIELFAPKLVLGISDEISSTGDIERIRRISAIVDEYNAQFEHIPTAGGA